MSTYQDLVNALRDNEEGSLFHHRNVLNDKARGCYDMLGWIGEELSSDEHIGVGLDGVFRKCKAHELPYGSAHEINFFPSDRTGGIHREFLGISAGSRRFPMALDSALSYCESTARAYPDHEEKTVVILTDTWDAPKFQQNYAGPFLAHLILHSVSFYFFLWTDFGTVRIPFPERNRIPHNFKNGQFPIDPSCQDMDGPTWGSSQALKNKAKNQAGAKSPQPLKNLAEAGYSYRGPVRGHDIHVEYRFDFKTMQYELYPYDPRNRMPNQGIIPINAAKNFEHDITPLLSLPQGTYGAVQTADAPHCAAALDGRIFKWYPGQDADALDSVMLSILQKAFERLIKAISRNYK